MRPADAASQSVGYQFRPEDPRAAVGRDEDNRKTFVRGTLDVVTS